MTNFINKNWKWLGVSLLLLGFMIAKDLSAKAKINDLNDIISDTKLDYKDSIETLKKANKDYSDSLNVERKKVNNLYYKINQLSKKANQIKKDKDEATNNINGYSVKQLDSILTNFRIRDTTETRDRNRIN